MELSGHPLLKVHNKNGPPDPQTQNPDLSRIPKGAPHEHFIDHSIPSKILKNPSNILLSHRASLKALCEVVAVAWQGRLFPRKKTHRGNIGQLWIWGWEGIIVICNKIVGRKFRMIILLHLGLVTFRFGFGKDRKVIMFMIFGFFGHVHGPPNQLF